MEVRVWCWLTCCCLRLAGPEVVYSCIHGGKWTFISQSKVCPIMAIHLSRACILPTAHHCNQTQMLFFNVPCFCGGTKLRASFCDCNTQPTLASRFFGLHWVRGFSYSLAVLHAICFHCLILILISRLMKSLLTLFLRFIPLKLIITLSFKNK